MIHQELRDKNSEILNRSNDSELEQKFRNTCSIYDSDFRIYDPPLQQAYQDYTNNYHQKTALYTINKGYGNKTNLFIYDTESGRRMIKVLETPELLDYHPCITQLPNNELFCFGNYPDSGISLKIDGNYEVWKLPSGTPCSASSAIYFNRNVYCFGGYYSSALTLSERFDLDANRWIKLAPMPQADYCCYSLIMNGKILISGYCNRDLLRYSIEGNTFEIIPFQFAANKRKILINAERLFLIECDSGSIYESEVSNDAIWRKIGVSIISNVSYQVYCSYNKEAINIACLDNNFVIAYYKFDLNKNLLTGML